MARFQVVRLNDWDEGGLYYSDDKADMYFTIHPIPRRRSSEFDSLDAPSFPVQLAVAWAQPYNIQFNCPSIPWWDP